MYKWADNILTRDNTGSNSFEAGLLTLLWNTVIRINYYLKLILKAG